MRGTLVKSTENNKWQVKYLRYESLSKVTETFLTIAAHDYIWKYLYLFEEGIPVEFTIESDPFGDRADITAIKLSRYKADSDWKFKSQDTWGGIKADYLQYLIDNDSNSSVLNFEHWIEKNYNPPIKK